MHWRCYCDFCRTDSLTLCLWRHIIVFLSRVPGMVCGLSVYIPIISVCVILSWVKFLFVTLLPFVSLFCFCLGSLVSSLPLWEHISLLVLVFLSSLQPKTPWCSFSPAHHYSPCWALPARLDLWPSPPKCVCICVRMCVSAQYRQGRGLMGRGWLIVVHNMQHPAALMSVQAMLISC